MKFLAPFIIAIVFSLSLCSSKDKAEPPPQQKAKVTFEGLTVPGYFQDAQASGFSNCKASTSGYECSIAQPKPILGIKPTSVKIHLNGNDNFTDTLMPKTFSGDVRTLPIEKLSYGDIWIEFPRDEYNSRCVEKESKLHNDKPTKCITNPGMNAFAEKLQAAGWTKMYARFGYEFYHPGKQMLISINRSESSYRIHYEKIENVNSALQRDAESKSNQKAAEAQAASVIKTMSEPKK